MSAEKKRTRTLIGKVVSNRMDKSITVLVERRVKHPVYGKYMTKSSKVHAHDEKNECNVGDVVSLRESKPISKTKAWQVVSILESTLVV
mgnify:CR=1 FL=1